MKAQIFMCGEGLGHTSRCLAVGERLLKEGHEAVFCAYGYSKKHIEGNGFTVQEIPSEIKLVGKSGSLSMRKSIEETLKGMDPLAYPRVFNLVKKEKPEVVISDSYFLGAIAAKMNRTPLLFILNQTDPSTFFRNRGIDIALIGKFVKKFEDIIYRYIDNIIIPDFPPPYTVCEKNIPLKPEILDKVEFVGPLVRKRYDEVKATKLAKPHIFSLVGGFGYRERLLHNVIHAAEMMEGFNFTLVCGPNVDSEGLKDEVKDNVNVIDYMNNVFPYIKGSDVIIAPGGHSTIMECLSFGKPILSFPDMFHSEQQNNAEIVRKLGVGMHLSYFTPPYMIAECIKESMKFKKNCSTMKDFSNRMDGTKKVVEKAEELAKK
ncbi:MAG: glycosyltransferase [Candidatus Altiarchaeota archaeon]|nr:glycosyltransferase [Candidatus Altiarchaeota archaeon]